MISGCSEVYVFNFNMTTLSPDIYERLVNAKVFIDDHFEESLHLATISLRANMSVFHFHRLFTKVYRITPHQYLTKKRLGKARQLLSTGSLNISVVCTDIGFESHGSFSTLFKKYQGLSPQSYRDNALQKQQRATANPLQVIPNCFLTPEISKK